MKRNTFAVFMTLALILAALFYIFVPMKITRPDGEEISKSRLNLGLDLQGGMYLKLTIDREKLPEGVKLKEAQERALEILRNRIDSLGVAEPVIQAEGEGDIVIQLPGIKEPERALSIIGKTAMLEFKMVSEKYQSRISEFMDKEGNPDPKKIPEGMKILPDKEGNFFVLEDKNVITGADLVDAEVQFDGQGQRSVGFKLAPDASKIFARATGNNIGRNLAIILDDKVYSAPTIQSRIKDSGSITGNFSAQEASDLAIVLRAGALPAPVKIINKYVVGPSLGADSIEKGKKSVIVGTLLVMLFMALYYGMSGVIADIALVLNVLLVVGILAAFKATLTLPGIAGITLTVGMAVDSNVLIFERIREELRSGKTIRAAIDAGYNRALWTIIDSHVTSLITAAILFMFGTGSIRGFAVTLFWGVSISMYTAFFVSKMIFDVRKQYNSLSI